MRAFLFIILIVVTATSCASIKQKSWLKNHDALLQESLISDDPDVLLNGLSESLVGMMDQSLGFVDPRKGVEYIKKYTGENKQSVDLIIDKLGVEMEEMNPLSKASFVIGLLKKDQIRNLIELAPKFQRKYKQISFMTKVMGKLTKVFGSLG